MQFEFGMKTNFLPSCSVRNFLAVWVLIYLKRKTKDVTVPRLQPFPNLSQLSAALGGLSGVPELEVEALRPVNLLQERNLLPPRPIEAPEPNLSPDLKKVNCSPQ